MVLRQMVLCVSFVPIRGLDVDTEQLFVRNNVLFRITISIEISKFYADMEYLEFRNNV